MASVGRDVKIYLDGFDLSGDMNAFAMRTSVDAEEATVWASGAHVSEPGLPTHQIEWGGMWQAGTDLLDEILQGRIGIANGVLLASPQTGADGESAIMLLVSQGEYRVQSEVGRAITFNGSLFATSRPLVRGTILHPKQSQAASGQGTGRQLGAVAAGRQVYAVLQVFSGSGTLDVVVQSDTSGFPSPEPQITFAQATGRAAEYATPVAGPITDDWWRVSYTIAGGPFVFAVAVGIY